MVRLTKLNNKSIYVLQIGASLCYKLGQLCFITNQGKSCYKLRQLHYYKLEQVLLQIRASITNQGNRYYKIGPLLQIGAGITNQGNYYKVGHNSMAYIGQLSMWTLHAIIVRSISIFLCKKSELLKTNCKLNSFWHINECSFSVHIISNGFSCQHGKLSDIEGTCLRPSIMQHLDFSKSKVI